MTQEQPPVITGPSVPFRLAIKNLIFIVSICLAIFGSSAFCAAFSREEIIDNRYLNGIDKVVLLNSFGHDTEAVLNIEVAQLDLWTYKSLSDLLSSTPGVTVASGSGTSDIPSVSARNKNAILVMFNLTARKEVVQGKTVKTAALTVELQQSIGNADPVDFSPHLPWFRSYPFYVPEDKQEFEKKIADGVRRLTGYLPFYFCLRDEKKAKSCKRDVLFSRSSRQ